MVLLMSNNLSRLVDNWCQNLDVTCVIMLPFWCTCVTDLGSDTLTSVRPHFLFVRFYHPFVVPSTLCDICPGTIQFPLTCMGLHGLHYENSNTSPDILTRAPPTCSRTAPDWPGCFLSCPLHSSPPSPIYKRSHAFARSLSPDPAAEEDLTHNIGTLMPSGFWTVLCGTYNLCWRGIQGQERATRKEWTSWAL